MSYEFSLKKIYEHFLFRLPNYGASSYLISVQKLHNATKEFYKKLKSKVLSFFIQSKVPVGIKDIKDHLGTCFNLVTEEMASLDTTVQGKETQGLIFNLMEIINIFKDGG